MSNRTAIVVVCLGVLLAGPAMASRPSAAARGKAAGKFALVIAPSDSSASIDEWVSSPVRHAITFHRIHAIEHGQTARVAFIVSGHAPGSDRLARVDVDISLRRPDGSLAYTKPGFGHLKGWECLAVGYAMADPTLELSVDPTDPPGQWRIEAVAHDRVTGATATASYPITFVK